MNKLTSLFEQVTDNRNIIGKIEGSFDKNDAHKLGKEAAKIVSKYLETKREEIFGEFIESFGKQKSATGILDIWIYQIKEELKFFLLRKIIVNQQNLKVINLFLFLIQIILY